MNRAHLLAVPGLLTLGACAGSAVNAPSLLPRPIESRSDAPPAPRDETVAPDPALDAQVAERRAVFEQAAAAFDKGAPGVEARLRRAVGAAEGSERWLDGQTAIGELQQLRTATDAAMVDLEELAIARGSAGQLPYPALDAAIAAAQARLEPQLATEARLRAIIGA